MSIPHPLLHALEALLAAEDVLDHLEIRAGGWSLCYERPAAAPTHPGAAKGASKLVPVLQRTIEEDILHALQKAGHRMVWTELLAALGPDNPWGESTVRHALCAMNQAGTLNNRQDVRPRGYGLASWE